MQCPKCSQELFAVEQSLVVLDCCPGCKGLWFDRGELEKIAGIADILSKVGAGIATELSCPRCGSVLSEHATDDAIGVNVERCHGCDGVWLDRAELDAFEKRERPKPDRRRPRPEGAHRKPEVLTLKEFLLKFIDGSLESLRKR